MAMSIAAPVRKVTPRPARAASRGYGEPLAECACPICGTTLPARKRSACSSRCRAELSRRQRVSARAAWLQAWVARAYVALGIV
jgi:predicted nucleic acid-binding Zn ribbon protein